MREIEPLWMLKYLPNMVASHLSIAYDARGPSNTICQSEASSSLAVAEAIRLIRRGAADVVLAGGTGSPGSLTKSLYVGDRELSHQIATPEHACRPFDKRRDGMVVGEGAGCIILERKAFAEARGAPILAEIPAVYCCFTPPDTACFSGGLAHAMNATLDRLHLAPHQISHLSASGYSTIRDDAAEARAIHEVFDNIPVIAPKSNFGNVGPAAGVIELIASILAMAHRKLPHVMNYEVPDVDCPVNVVRDQPASLSLQGPLFAISSCHAQTGQIVSTAISVQ